MRLMVGEALEIVTMVQKILRYYQENGVKNIKDMLDDIYLCSCAAKDEKALDSPGAEEKEKAQTRIDRIDQIEKMSAAGTKKPGVKKTVKKKELLKGEADYLQLEERLLSLEREQAEELLVGYKKDELCAFADYMSISILKSDRKAKIAGQIYNHYGFRTLNTNIGQRPRMER